MRYRPEVRVLPRLFVRVARPAAFGLVALLVPFASPGQVVRERVSVEAVTVTVTARDGAGRPVRDLRASDLALSVDGKPAMIDTFALEPRPTTVSASEVAAPPTSPAPTGSVAGRAADAITTPAPEPAQLAVLIDEGGTSSLDRRDVYRQLERYLGNGASVPRSVMIARLNGPEMNILCPWTQDSRNSRAALQELVAHPRVPRIVSPYEVPALGKASNDSLQKEVLFARDNLFRAILVMIAAFPPAPARRSLVLVSGGIALLSPPDFAAIRGTTNFAGAESQRSRAQFPDPSHDLEQARIGFEVWSNAQRRDWYAQLADVMAKAQENNVALVSVAAEAFDRGTNPGAESNTTGPSTKWPVRPMPGAGPPASSGLSPRLHVGQTMTTMAIQTGGEAILEPLQTADRLSRQQAIEPYVLTFRDPFPDDHRRHRVEITTARRGVNLQYRRGYRTPTEEEEVLDSLMARLVGPAPASNPLAANVRISRSENSTGSVRLHLNCEFQPPPEHGLEAEAERSVELLLANVDDSGNRSDPAKWTGTARRVGTGGLFAADFELNLPLRNYRWSIAVQDGPTGLVSYVITESRP